MISDQIHVYLFVLSLFYNGEKWSKVDIDHFRSTYLHFIKLYLQSDRYDIIKAFFHVMNETAAKQIFMNCGSNNFTQAYLKHNFHFILNVLDFV